MEQPICVACGAKAPPTNTENTLVSSAHAWRFTRVEGTTTFEWRCRKCWEAARRASRPEIPTSPPSGPRGFFAAAIAKLRGR